MHGANRQSGQGARRVLLPAGLAAMAYAVLAGAAATVPGEGAGVDPALLVLALVAGLSGLALARIQAHRKQAERTLNALPIAIVQLDATGSLRYVNPAGAAMLGLSGAAAPAAWQLIDHATRAPVLEDLLARSGREGLTRIPPGARLINALGLELEVEGTCQPLRDAGGVGYLLQWRDVTEEAEWRRQQPDLWDRDPVSSLPGSHFMAHRINLALINRRAGDIPMTYLHIEIGGIQAVYQDDGDTAGDSLVRHLTALLRAQVRETDLVARMGAETFAVLLPLCPAEVATHIAAKIDASLAGFRFEWTGSTRPIRAALGRVDVPPFPGGLDELLAAAQPRLS